MGCAVTAKLLHVRALDREQDLSDQEILSRCAAGDERALGALYRRHSLTVYRFLSRLVGASSPDLDDLAQAVFLVAWRRSADFRPNAPVSSWLFGIAANAVRDRRRSERRLFRLLTRFKENEPPPAPAPDAVAMHRELVDRAGAAVRMLPIDLQVAYVMCDIEEVPCREAAEILGLRIGTLWRRLHDARKRLRKALLEDAK